MKFGYKFMRVQTYLPKTTTKKFNQRCLDENTKPYKLAQKLIRNGLEPQPEPDLTKIPAKKLLDELWRRVPGP